MTATGEGWHPFEVAALTLLATAALAAVPVWVAAQATALAFSGDTMSLGLSDTVRRLPRLLHSPGDGAHALAPAVPAGNGPVALFYMALLTVLTAVLALAAAITTLALRARELRPVGGVGRDPQPWARPRDVRRALGRHGSHGGPGLLLGSDARTGAALRGAAEDSALYLGPPRSGKGVHLVIPQTLDAPGAVVVTATRPDTLRHTWRLRARRGPVVVFDPQGLAPEAPRLRWAPQHGCTDPLVAIIRARGLAAAAAFTPTTTDADFWAGMTAAVLRCHLHAAALDDRPTRDLLGWAARPTDPTPARILRTHPDAAGGWAEELTAQAAADPRQRDGVWAGVRRAVDALADPRVLATCSPPPGEQFDPHTFLTEGGALYLLGSTGAQLTVAPLVTALLEDLLDVARRHAATQPGGRLDPPLTLLLDEAANIAPIPSLPSLLADGGGVGITTAAVLQSLAQARTRWGSDAADAMWDAATLKVVLGGLAHAEDLQRISALAGDRDAPTRSETRGRDGRTVTQATQRQPALPVTAIRNQPAGTAIVLARRLPPIPVRLQPWWDRGDAAAIRAALRAS